MRLNVSAWAIRRPLAPLVLFMVLLVLGLASFRSFAVTRLPNVDVPVVSVTVTESGAAPAELQGQVTWRVEDAVAGVPGAKHITSTITSLGPCARRA
ncbi:efflux RND transporter permease subunit [Lichenibacterium ramalinae]|uniref:Efflux RND transporter permease subunit n=1 Tax=Lichenibacterium ramalinae TaxID=2316527 RepID=A0A4Q2RCK8_9HYPH|nr:efflux RND transporter permease subunit [Lichenibacterium ramalinae]